MQGELHGGRRAAGDARFLYDNECLWAGRMHAGSSRALGAKERIERNKGNKLVLCASASC